MAVLVDVTIATLLFKSDTFLPLIADMAEVSLQYHSLLDPLLPAVNKPMKAFVFEELHVVKSQ